MKRAIQETIKKVNRKYDKIHWGNLAVYTFILLLFSQLEEVNFDCLLEEMKEMDNGLVNPILDVVSMMIYESNELIYIDSRHKILVLTAKGKTAASTCTL